MSATTATSGKSKTAGKVAPSRPPSHVSAANQHSNGTVMTKPNTSANLVKSGNTSAKPVVQPKLTVGKPNDSFEQQADAMAQKVVEMTPADVRQLSQSKHPPKQPNSASEKKSPRSPLQKKDQPGSFMLQASAEKEKVSKKEDDKIKKKEDEKLKKKADEKILKAPEKKIQPIAEVEKEKKKGAEEKVQKKTEPEKIQKAPAILTSAEKLLAKLFPVQPKPVQLKEDEKLQKTEELKKKADEKIQKKAEPEKIQKTPEQKVLAKETVQPKPTIVQAKPVQLKEEEKLRKVEEKKKTEEKVQKKAEPEKIQKAEPKILASKETVQAKPVAVQTKPLQLKEEEKLQKIEDEKKKTEEKVQKKTEDKILKADANNILPAIQKSPAAIISPVQKKDEEKLQKAGEEKIMKTGEKKEEDKIHKAGEEKIMKAAEKKDEPKVQKAEEEKVMKAAEGNESELSPEFESRLQGTMAGGSPMDRNLLGYMESRFDVDFSAVRFHNDQQSAQLCNEIGAQAFAYKNHVYFNRGKYNPDSDKGRFLIAHELTHVIQQGYATAKGEGETKAQVPAVAKAEEKVQSSSQNISPSSPRVQRLGLSDILDGLAALAANIPGFTLLTVILGRNPINMQSVDRSPLNILHGFIGLIPGGEILFQILSQYNVAQRIASWIGQQVEAMGINFSSLRDAFTRFTDSLSWSDIFSPGDVWRRAKDIFTPFITRIINFVAQLITQAIAWLKETFMQPLSDFCREIPGYTLVTVLLGRDPFTNAAVPRTAMNVVKAFAEFIPGGTEKVKELEESKALEKAYAWFISETQSRNLTWDRVAGTFTTAWESLKLEDVLSPIATLARIGAMFRPLMSDLIGFAVAALIKLLEFIYEAVMGAGGSRVLAIIKKSQATFLTVIKNPVGFLSNLVTAVGMGIRQFAGNILVHLQTGVISWLTGTLSKAGVELPAKWDLMGILKFIMGLLGITWPRIRAIAVEVFGAKVVDVVEKVAGIVMDIKEKGFVQTIKDRINEYFSGLKDMILGKIKSFIQERIVMAGIAQLVSLLSPVGAVIQAIIKTYQTVMFFIQKINQILDFVESIVDSIAAIAAGSLGAAASRVEQTMARTIPLILDFLARMIGLGDVSGKIKSLIEQAQEFIAGKIRQAMMWAKAQMMKLVESLLKKDKPLSPEEKKKAIEKGIQYAHSEEQKYVDNEKIGKEDAEKVATAVSSKHKVFTSFVVVDKGDTWGYHYTASPGEDEPGKKKMKSSKELYDLAKGNFVGDKVKFKYNELVTFLTSSEGISAKTVQRRVNDWKTNMGETPIYTYESKKKDPNKDMCFVDGILSKESRPVDFKSRATYGYHPNILQSDSDGLAIIMKGFNPSVQEAGYQPGDESKLDFLHNKAIFISAKTHTQFKWMVGGKNHMVLGHGHDAATHWNTGGGVGPFDAAGHTQLKSQNLQWNKNPANYHGPEEKYESAATGGGTENYQPPGPDRTPPSHPMWWDPSDPNYPK
jgi:hypothetical protein